ncbi:glycosyltransferase family 2 protein, partial [Nocardia salmonicida]
MVTVTYSPGEHLEHFITTLADATTEKPQVILADNGSTDGVPELVAEANSHVPLLPNCGHIGCGG